MLEYLNKRLITLENEIKITTSSSKRFPLLAKEKKRNIISN